ncbi:hypothetical protein BKA62DRAFT_722061 [Auriculariales sp. MPI-PUGE-AT-0066]|nr:hypothetical protein BKA62DRAFT_722061 [Auriculariales sp. MPI-PUGE-AT-0066]
MCSISRMWRSFLLTAPTIWSEGDIGTFADLRWIAKYHQNTPLRLRTYIPLHEPGPIHHQVVNGPSPLSHTYNAGVYYQTTHLLNKCFKCFSLLLGGQPLKSSTYVSKYMGAVKSSCRPIWHRAFPCCALYICHHALFHQI